MNHEEQMIQEVLEGKAASFRGIIDRYQRPVFRMISNMIHDHHAAEDITQDVFIAVFKKISTEGGNIINVENELMGINHGFVGGMMADAWKLPEGLGEAIKYHHKPQRAKSNPLLVAVVSLADHLCQRKDLEYGETKDSTVSESTWGILREIKDDLDESCVDGFLVDMDDELEGIEEFMKLLQ